MAIIECIECKGKVSDIAESCPHCGAPVELSIKKEKLVPKCFECDKELKEGQAICENCGVDQALNPMRKAESKQKKAIPVDASTSSAPKPKAVEKEIPRKEKQEAKPQVVIIKQERRKSSGFRRLLITLAIIAVVLVGIFYMIPNDVKRSFYEEFGIENSNFVKNHGLASYVQVQVRERTTITGRMAVSGVITNDHPTTNIRAITLRFHFTDGSEDRTITKDFFPSVPVKLFDQKFDDHRGASLVNVEVIDAQE